ncbi:MAG: GAF domain-containing protein [Cyanobacteria bacterium]|nr:GAF domain-containing protein [Cyanobacteriota bacterium]
MSRTIRAISPVTLEPVDCSFPTTRRTILDPRLSYETAYAPLGFRAHVTVPLIRDREWVACLCAVFATPRVWQPRERRLLESAAERLWHAVREAPARCRIA